MSEQHDPYDHDPSEADWGKSPFSGDGSGNCVLSARFPNGDIWLGDDKDLTRPHLAFRRDEWAAVVAAIEARDPRFTP
ncbi:DUF397 domain-containing protein [Kitasatospora sp. NBC_01250]|uniref:DUF397 domain-containing protein n=1 Tax=Kitasatospora sp. NBC_01250 TaxID=2903571 RepID=UPI002E345A1B|nr:DUF397 domain-containing protein [Kitasatospora sp. NBC_01250]